MFRRFGFGMRSLQSGPHSCMARRCRTSSAATSLPVPPLRPITALYGSSLYRLESFMGMKGYTLYDPLPVDTASHSDCQPSGQQLGEHRAALAAEESTSPKRRKHVNRYMNPVAHVQQQATPSSAAPKPSKGRPVYTVKPVLRYPMLQPPSVRGMPTEPPSSRKQQYLNIKAPEMLIFEVTELGSDSSAVTSGVGSGVAGGNSSTPVIVGTHHVAVFKDGTVVGFGLHDAALRRIRSEVFDTHAEPKDEMLIADKEVIRLAARTNLCVFPAVGGDEADTASPLGNIPTVPTSGIGSMNRKRLQSIIPTSAAAIHRLAKGASGTDISLRYRFTTAEDISNASVEAKALSNLKHGIVASDTSSGIAANEGGESEAAAYSHQTPLGSYIDDRHLEAVVLSENTALAILPFAFCFFELIQLRAFNALVFPIHERVSQWQLHVAEKGTLPMSLKEARVMKAKLMRIASRQSKMTARRHRLLWEDQHTAGRQVFEAAAEHFELFARNDGFKRRADGVQASLAYLCDQAHHQKDVILEWVIILLIMVEVYIAVKTHSHDYDEPESEQPTAQEGPLVATTPSISHC